jgi:hypothetical protein
MAKTSENIVTLNSENSEYKWIVPQEYLKYKFAVPQKIVKKALTHFNLI